VAAMRRAAIKRRPATPKRSALKAHRDPGYTGETRELARALRAAWSAEPGSCAVCGSGVRVQGHHVAEKQWIKTVARLLMYSVVERLRALWDTRNRLWICERCHMAHHGFVEGRRIRREVVLAACPELLAFLDEHGLWFRFDRAYPEQVRA
jgi:hypothetical protein